MAGGNIVPRITEAEHIGPSDTGDNIEAKRVVGYMWNPVGINLLSGQPTGAYEREGIVSTSKFDVSASPVFYIGTAPIGTSASAVGWLIQKFDLTDLANINGPVATDVSWNNRATGTYA